MNHLPQHLPLLRPEESLPIHRPRHTVVDPLAFDLISPRPHISTVQVFTT
jgi:hypothetical protein